MFFNASFCNNHALNFHQRHCCALSYRTSQKSSHHASVSLNPCLKIITIMHKTLNLTDYKAFFRDFDVLLY